MFSQVQGNERTRGRPTPPAPTASLCLATRQRIPHNLGMYLFLECCRSVELRPFRLLLLTPPFLPKSWTLAFFCWVFVFVPPNPPNPRVTACRTEHRDSLIYQQPVVAA